MDDIVYSAKENVAMGFLNKNCTACTASLNIRCFVVNLCAMRLTANYFLMQWLLDAAAAKALATLLYLKMKACNMPLPAWHINGTECPKESQPAEESCM